MLFRSAKIRPAFRSDAEFQAFVQKVAQMRQAAATQEQRFGPQQFNLKSPVASLFRGPNPLATPRGDAARTVAEANPLAPVPPAMRMVSDLLRAAALTPSVVYGARKQ